MVIRRLLSPMLAILMSLVALDVSAADLTPEELKFFETKIRPVLIKECYGCHSNKSGNARGGLRLDTKQLTHIGGSSGPAVVPGDLEESLLFNAIIHEDFVMPPKRKLSDDVIDDFRKWIEMGAPDPRETKVAAIKSTISDDDIVEAKKSFWAYKKPAKFEPPRVADADWPSTDIDRFILAELEKSKLSPAADAESYKVLRRLCFDLVGLPPSPEQIDSFSRAWRTEGPDAAIEFVVDRLLGKEQYGERWGRHWLDVARYGESTGRQVNMTFPHAWRYRDYVIDSFNDDKPYDRFVAEQLAGDLLPVASDEQWAENLVATTFLAMGPKNVNEQNGLQFAADLADEQIDTTTRVFLGMSVACARCHDHKFDAIPQTDYYAMAGIFTSTATFFGNPPSEFGSFSGVQTRRNSSLLLLPIDDPNPYDKKYSPEELTSLKKEFTEKLASAAEARRRSRGGQGDSGNARLSQQQRIRTANELASLSAKLAVVDDNGMPRSYCMGVQDRSVVADARVLVRGEIDQPGQYISRGFPRVLCDQPASIQTDSSGRLELARWIGSEDNPLTARVMVNRIWKHLIGQGIVASTENFGVTGQTPSHPELLDYLAVRFVESGWSVKTIVREIVTSHVYRMSSQHDDKCFECDPDNVLVWRANPRRLDGEAIRDAMLSISGEIDFERPRGSEVAKAGYVRVRDGVLGDPREAARFAMGQMGRDAISAMRQRAQSGRPELGGGEPGRAQFEGRQQGRPQFGGRQLGQPGQARASGRQRQAGQQRSLGPQRQAGLAGRGRFDFRGRMGMQGQGYLQDFASRVQDRLDMNDAKFRSVYLPIVRDEVPRSLEVFDFAEPSMVVGSRESSNTANQALYMMNNRFVIAQSEAFAQRVTAEGTRMSDRVRAAFLLAYGRPPTNGERAAVGKFFTDFPTLSNYRSREPETLTAFCQSLLASAEFRYID